MVSEMPMLSIPVLIWMLLRVPISTEPALVTREHQENPSYLTTGPGPVQMVMRFAGRRPELPQLFEIEVDLVPSWNPQLRTILRGFGSELDGALQNLEEQIAVWICQ
jgi:hypothetical protein